MALWNGNGKVTEEVTLEKVYKMLKDVLDRVKDIEEAICDPDGNNSELKELKAEIRENNKFVQSLVFSLVESKKAADAKPTAAELYMQNKKEREEREAAEALRKKSNGALVGTLQNKLPG